MNGSIKVPIYAKFDGEEFHVGDWDIRIEGDYGILAREEAAIYSKVITLLQRNIDEATE